MKEFKTIRQQINILRKRGLIVPKNGKPKKFLEENNYYNVINGYKYLFLEKDTTVNLVNPECFVENTHFDSLKFLFLFDRELRIIFLKYILIFENTFKSILSYVFTKKYPNSNSYLDKTNFSKDRKSAFNQIIVSTKILSEQVDYEGPIKHYLDVHTDVPFWVLVNRMTLGNLSHFYDSLQESEKNEIANKFYTKYNKEYKTKSVYKLQTGNFRLGLKIIYLVRNMCAHDERLYNVKLKTKKINDLRNLFNLDGNTGHNKLIDVILFLKFLLNKNDFKNFYLELTKLLAKYRDKFDANIYDLILDSMGIEISELKKLK